MMISHLVRFLAMFQDFTTGVEVANHHFFGGKTSIAILFFFSWWHPRSAAWDFTKGGWSTELYRRLEVPLVLSSVLRGNFRNEELWGDGFSGDDHTEGFLMGDLGPWLFCLGHSWGIKSAKSFFGIFGATFWNLSATHEEKTSRRTCSWTVCGQSIWRR